jgi:hypothetical protein
LARVAHAGFVLGAGRRRIGEARANGVEERAARLILAHETVPHRQDLIVEDGDVGERLLIDLLERPLHRGDAAANGFAKSVGRDLLAQRPDELPQGLARLVIGATTAPDCVRDRLIVHVHPSATPDRRSTLVQHLAVASITVEHVREDVSDGFIGARAEAFPERARGQPQTIVQSVSELVIDHVRLEVRMRARGLGGVPQQHVGAVPPQWQLELAVVGVKREGPVRPQQLVVRIPQSPSDVCRADVGVVRVLFHLLQEVATERRSFAREGVDPVDGRSVRGGVGDVAFESPQIIEDALAIEQRQSL